MSRKPTLRELIRMLRSLNAVIDGPYTVALTYDSERWDGTPYAGWGLEEPGYYCEAQYGREELPGDDQAFDAVAAARRLLAAWRDAQP